MQHGQITIFLVMGLVIVGTLVAFMLLSAPETSEQQVQFDVSSTKTAIDLCMAEAMKDSLQIAFLKGLGEDYETIGSIDVSYYFVKGLLLGPTQEGFEHMLGELVSDSLPLCLDGIVIPGHELDIGEIESALVTLGEQEVFVDVHMPIVVRHNAKQVELDSFRYVAEAPAADLLEAIEGFLSMQAEFPEGIPLDGIQDLGKKYGVNISYYIYDALLGKVYFTIQKDSLVSSFMVQYDWYSLEEKKVTLEEIPDIHITGEDTVFYQVVASGEGVTYSDDSDLFDINAETGIIRLDSTMVQSGHRQIYITATDAYGNSDFKVMHVHIDHSENLPVIEDIPDFTIRRGDLFEYTVRATEPTGLYLVLQDDSPLFVIGPVDSEISAVIDTPGVHEITISATNPYGYTTKSFTLEVLE